MTGLFLLGVTSQHTQAVDPTIPGELHVGVHVVPNHDALLLPQLVLLNQSVENEGVGFADKLGIVAGALLEAGHHAAVARLPLALNCSEFVRICPKEFDSRSLEGEGNVGDLGMVEGKVVSHEHTVDLLVHSFHHLGQRLPFRQLHVIQMKGLDPGLPDLFSEAVLAHGQDLLEVGMELLDVHGAHEARREELNLRFLTSSRWAANPSFWNFSWRSSRFLTLLLVTKNKFLP